MIKIKLATLLLCYCVIAPADELKVTVLNKTTVKYSNCDEIARINCKYDIRILCVDGYKWMHFGYTNGSISQMFDSTINDGLAKPIKCKN